MNVVSDDPNLHDSHVVAASDLRENAAEKLRELFMDEWQPPQCRPRQHPIESNGHHRRLLR